MADVVPAPGNWFWRSDPVSPGPAVVFDMDGVLSDAAARQHLLEEPGRDWKAFFEASIDDPVIHEVAELLSVLDDRMQILLLTARPLDIQRRTLDWLARHELRWDLLVMREMTDHGASRDYKRRSVGEMRGYGFDLRLAFEDDRRNVEMFHREGVPCVYIHSGYYD